LAELLKLIKTFLDRGDSVEEAAGKLLQKEPIGFAYWSEEEMGELMGLTH